MKNIAAKKYFPYIILSLLCLPLFFINIRNSLGWDGDQEQYIHQALNIVKGIPQSETGFIYEKPGYGPPACLMGFPLMLAPVYYFWGYNIPVFCLFITAALFLLCIALFAFFRRYFSVTVSMLLVLLVAYNPETITMKMQVMSDIPFALLLVLFMLVYSNTQTPKHSNTILSGVLLGMLISVRGIGIVVAAAVIFNELLETIRRYKENKLLIINYQLLITLFAASLVYALLNVILFHLPTGGGFSYYRQVFGIENLIHIVPRNITYCFLMFRNYFAVCTAKLPFIASIIQSVMLTFSLVGFIIKCIKKTDFIDLVVIFYMLILFIYPFMLFNERFIFPVFPFFLYYFVIGLRSVKFNIAIDKNVAALLFGLFVLLPCFSNLLNVVKTQNETLDGPQEPASLAAFEYIKQHTPADAVFASEGPRILALYAGRKGIRITNDELTRNAAQLVTRLKATRVNYMLIYNKIPNAPPDNYLAIKPLNLQLVWNNAKFRLYELRW